MLDQYIMNQLEKIDEEFHKLEEKLRRLHMEEESSNHIIKKLLDEEDVGIEFFSPRNSEDSTRQKVSRIKKQIEDIRQEQASVTDELTKLKEEENRYQEILLEIREKKENNSSKLSKSAIHFENDKNKREETIEKREDLNNSLDKEELKKILKRIDKCLNLLNTNRTQCKNEMINLKYYLKALISSK